MPQGALSRRRGRGTAQGSGGGGRRAAAAPRRRLSPLRCELPGVCGRRVPAAVKQEAGPPPVGHVAPRRLGTAGVALVNWPVSGLMAPA